MAHMISLRIDQSLLDQIDRERNRRPRARVIHEALSLWLAMRREERAIAKDQGGYAEKPVDQDEFMPFMKLQSWPR